MPELERLRLSSIDPAELDRDLVDLLADEPRLMPHLHLSVQAGDDLILKRMKRRHGRDDVLRLSERLRRLRPEIAFGADLIAGFPTESEAMFANTLASDRRGRSGLSARVSVLGAGGHAGRAHAAGAEAGAQGAGRAAARRRRPPARGARSRRRSAGPLRVLVEAHGRGHTEAFAPFRFTGAAPPAGRVVEAVAREVEDQRAARPAGRMSEARRAASSPASGGAARRASRERRGRRGPRLARQAARASWFQRLRAGLGRSSSRLKDNIAAIFTRRRLDAASLEELEEALISADLGVETAARAGRRARPDALRQGGQRRRRCAARSRESVAAILEPGSRSRSSSIPTRRPQVILVCGVNGTGKTTTIGKLAAQLKAARRAGGAGGRRHLPRRGDRAARDLGRARRRAR